MNRISGTDGEVGREGLRRTRRGRQEGFTLAETLMALLVLSVGLLATGELLCITLRSISLSRTKDIASTILQGKLDDLGALYRQDPAAGDLAIGNHGPEQVTVTEAGAGSTLNSFSITWTVAPLEDPRPGKVLEALQVIVTATPVRSDNTVNNQAAMNKVVSIASVLSPRAP